MPLTDPELDLLRELLSDDPTDEVFLQVGEELVRRAAWEEAEDVLRRGLEAHSDEPDGWALLARAALEIGDFSASLRAWTRSGTKHQGGEEMRRVHVLALERAGRAEEARDFVDAYLASDPGDVVLQAAKERLDAPPPEGDLSAADPFLTVRRAEQYAAMGRIDRATRIYRRILFRHPGDIAIRARLLQLDSAEIHDDELTHDLSEELIDPNLVPPDLTMPMPAITSASVKPAPPRSDQPSGLAEFVASAREAERRVHLGDVEEDEMPTSPNLAGRPRKRRKRRTLLKR
ncbi:MAG: hypothetical protein H6737_24885 [Alphaproteobacteria bacterium]|nr:hypothetical protein [Alphaproteobacteria bacterium]